MNYQTIHTLYGLVHMAAAEAAGISINLIEMAVGDGAGNATSPSEAQTHLVREMYRGRVNRVFQDPVNPKQYTAELVVPASIGGFTLREVGVFDADGGLFAVGNLPTSYKPSIGEGAYSDTVVRITFLVTNSGIVTLQLDPNVVVATHTWVTNNVTAGALIPGGTTSQILAKKSNADGDTEWINLDAVNVTVDMIEERQALAAGQTMVTMAITTTRGLAVYIEGVRINKGAGADEWSVADNGTSQEQIVLGKAYAAGTKILTTQNEPTGSVPAPMERSQNLADVLDKATARTNLDVYSKAESDQKAPASSIMYFARLTAPAGWLKANGAAISRTAYAGLYAAIGTAFGAGDGFNTFNLPDLRGEFIRGWDDGRGVDPGRALNTRQAGDLASHSHGASSDAQGLHSHTGATETAGDHAHSGTTSPAGQHQHDSGWGESGNRAPYGVARTGAYGSGQSDNDNNSNMTSVAGEHTHDFRTDTTGNHAHRLTTENSGQHAHNISVAAAGGSETRPRNMALLACIKY